MGFATVCFVQGFRVFDKFQRFDDLRVPSSGRKAAVILGTASYHWNNRLDQLFNCEGNFRFLP